MSFFVAATWSILALFALNFLGALLASAHAGHVDLVSGVLCQAIAFLSTLLFLTLVHEKDRPLSEVFGLRKTSPALCLIAVLLGLALVGPLSLVADVVYRHFPAGEEEASELIEMFRAPALHQKIALVLAAGFLGPLVEEMFFRGALLRGLRRQHSPAITVIGVALLFAGAHANPRNFPYDFLGGLAMGYVRVLSGSLWPAILLHAAFNTVSIGFALRFGPEADIFTRTQSLAATLVAVVLLALYRLLALRSETSAQARAADSGMTPLS